MGDEEIEILDWRDDFLAAHVDENNATLPVPIVNVVDKSTDDDSAVYTGGLGDETRRRDQAMDTRFIRYAEYLAQVHRNVFLCGKHSCL